MQKLRAVKLQLAQISHARGMLAMLSSLVPAEDLPSSILLGHQKGTKRNVAMSKRRITKRFASSKGQRAALCQQEGLESCIGSFNRCRSPCCWPHHLPVSGNPFSRLPQPSGKITNRTKQQQRRRRSWGGGSRSSRLPPTPPFHPLNV